MKPETKRKDGKEIESKEAKRQLEEARKHIVKEEEGFKKRDRKRKKLLDGWVAGEK